MKNSIPAFAFLLLGVVACSLPVLQAADEPASPAQKFARKAAVGSMLEIKAGELAGKNAESPAVKEFGAMMVTDHGKASQELMAIAGKESLKLPAQLPKKMQAKLDKLAGLTGKAFDTAYVNDMVMAHEKDLAEFKTAESELSDPALKEFAASTSKVIAMHLEHIKTIQADLAK